jgi:hypothetical protein
MWPRLTRMSICKPNRRQQDQHDANLRDLERPPRRPQAAA